MDGALISNATTLTYSLLNSTTPNWTEAVTVVEQSRDRATPTTAEPSLTSSAVGEEQLEAKDISRDSQREEDESSTEDGKPQLGWNKSKSMLSGNKISF